MVKYYTRACNFYFGQKSKRKISEGKALPLSNNHLISFDTIEFSQKKNTDVLVLDHHQSEVKLPNAFSVVNPNRFDDESKLNYLCAAGVCFMFLIALNKKLRDLNWFKENKKNEPILSRERHIGIMDDVLKTLRSI